VTSRLRAQRSALARGTAGICCAFALTAQTPQPAPSTLPVIGGTRAKGFCAMLRDNVAPSVAGLMKTDELVGAGHRAALKAAHDQTTSPAEALDLDTAYMRRVAASMAHNLAVIRKLLADEKRFPKNPVTDDDRYALLLKAQVQDAAARQEVALNHLSGIVETTAMGAMANDIDKQMASTVSSGTAASTATPSTGDQFLGVTTLPGSGPGGMFERGGAGTSNVRGHTIWDKLAGDIEVQQTRIAGAEQALSPTVIAAAAASK
jgi:hypothetical protein